MVLDPSFRRPATEAVTEGAPEFSLPVDPLAASTTAYPGPEDVCPSPGSVATFEDFSHIATPKAVVTSLFKCSGVSVVAFPTPLTDSLSRQPTTGAIAEGAPGSSFYPLPSAAIAGYTGEVHPSPEGAVGLFQDANAISQVEDGLPMLSFCCSEAPMAVFPPPSTDSLSSQPATKTITEGAPDFPFHSPPAGPVLGDPTPPESLDESQFYLPDSYPTVASPPPTDLGQDLPVGAIGAEPGINLFLFNLAPCLVHKRQKCGDFTHLGEQVIWVYNYVCLRCKKHFSGKLERDRHIKSHGPPTIGCRRCEYTQSRKDLFNQHCKKRHPAESSESLMVPLVPLSE
ncbi:hypothetical protein BJV78DRAFT_1151730 [Lactifluus subvellereus]|nr:hypothetical protein BJV78DRAFT_1151730 [Lactifluus subvellereus]